MEEKVGFALLGLKTEQFATFEENFSQEASADLKTSIEFKINKELRQLAVFATFSFEQKEKVFLKIQISSHFRIAEESWNSFATDEKIILPKGFMEHVTLLTIGSARGVLHAKTEGTIFNKFLLPTINVTALIDKDAEFVFP